MKELYWQSWSCIIAFLICLAFLWVPGPYTMVAFTFVAQPLFLLGFLGFTYKVFKELRRQKIL